MRRLRLSAFWQAVLVLLVAYLVYDNAFPPLLPRALMLQYMAITALGVLLYFAFDDDRWNEFKAPVASLLRDDDRVRARRVALLLAPAFAGYVAYAAVAPDLEPPPDVRQAHPTPPEWIEVYGKRFHLAALENPVRREIIETLERDEAEGWGLYERAVTAGRDLYFRNCLHCHGDLLDGRGRFAGGLRPSPTNFQDPTILPQLEESYLFWRITLGGAGLPREGAPWDSSMPAWQETLGERDVWNLIVFLFDYIGQVPRIWDPAFSRRVTAMRDKVAARRAALEGVELYRAYCAVCHGERGAGDGVAADLMYPKPRDFSLALFKYKRSAGSLPPTDEDLVRTIKQGLPGTAMSGWGIEGRALLTDAQIASLVPVVKSFDITGTWAPEGAADEAFDDDGFYTGTDFRSVTEGEPLVGRVPFSEESVAKGRIAFEKVCGECHGTAGRGNIRSGKRLADDWGDRLWPRDLTKPWSWRGVPSVNDMEANREQVVEAIYRGISTGLPGTPMPAHRAPVEGASPDPVSAEDRWHMAHFVYTLAAASTPPQARSVIEAARVVDGLPAEAGDPRWDGAPQTTLRLVPNIVAGQRLFTPLNDAVTVRALYSENEIAFLVEVNDRTESRPGIAYFTELQDATLRMQPDAFAIRLPREAGYLASMGGERPHLVHGNTGQESTIWYWNAGSVDPSRAPFAALLDERGVAGALVPRESGAEDLEAEGTWMAGRWRVVMKRPRRTEGGDLVFEAGRFIPISFANWDGSNGEAGSRHTLTAWAWLLLPHEPEPSRTYGLPAAAASLVFVAGALLVRSQRRGKARRGGTRVGNDRGQVDWE